RTDRRNLKVAATRPLTSQLTTIHSQGKIANPPEPLYTTFFPKRPFLPWSGGEWIKSNKIMNDEGSSTVRPRCRSLTGVRIIGTGSYVPDAVVTNEHLHERFGFDSNWIVKRTGILERRHALPHQATSDLCHEAAR